MSEAVVSPQTAAAQSRVVCLSTIAAAVWGGGTGIPAATLSAVSPKFPSPVSPQASPVHSASTFAGAQGKWLQVKICALVL